LDLSWIKLSEEFRLLIKEVHRDLFRSHNTVRIVKYRRLRWASHMAMTGRGDTTNAYRIMVGKPLGKCATWETDEIGG
jgi:hypothetical protein